MPRLTITNTPGAAINPYIYGNFMEFIERHISGMWAEMLENRRLEDCIAGKATPEYWLPYSQNNDARFALDNEAFSGTVCQKVECAGDYSGWSGLVQQGIGVTKGRNYTGSIYLRGQGVSSAEIALGKDYGPFFQAYTSAVLTGITGEWQKFTFGFTSDATSDDAEFLIRFQGKGDLRIDHPSLMPADNLDGWRKDVVEHIRALKPGIIRFPGGCYADIYHWQNAVGERDKRRPQSNFHWSDVPHDYRLSDLRTGRHWRPTEPNDVGTDEFMRLCELTGTEALICVNLGTGTAEEAAAWVEYCNGPADSQYGEMRSRNGHPAPYNIRYWQIGNEMFGGWEIGYTGREGYIRGYKAFRAAMAAADPGIRFLIDGNDGEWNRAMLRECSGLFDYIDVHFYPHWDIEIDANPTADVYRHFFSRLAGVEKAIDELRRDIADAGLAGRVKVAVCEHNLTGGGWGATRAFLGTQGVALFVAGLVGLMAKNADLIEIGNYSNLTNAWWASCIRTRREQSHTTAAFHVLGMYSRLFTGRLLPCSLECASLNAGKYNTFDRDAANEEDRIKSKPSGIETIPSMHALACLNGDEIVIAAVNYTESITRLGISLEGFGAPGEARIEYTAARAMHWLNDFDSPDRVAPVQATLESGADGCELEPCSVTFVQVKIQEAHTT